ncbi:intraflagellar transport protein rempA [Brevipalpus obovatus]|uniref:intraflagellar transport protein rempA n=1 Tax=Brevipalpus obovatus TaxID=246614 RepID=UPI003D9DB969
MTSFIEYSVDDNFLQNSELGECIWSKVVPLLALAAYDSGGTIRILDAHGCPVLDSHDQASNNRIPVRISSRISQFAWHSKHFALAVAWDNGELGLLTVNGNKTKWTESVGNTILLERKWIILLRWMATDSQLITVSSNGQLVLWNLNLQTDELIATASHQMIDQVIDLIDFKSNDSSCVLIGTTSGSIHQLILSSGSMSELIRLDFSVQSLIHYSKKNRLLVATENCRIYQYGIGINSDELTELSQMKLEVSRRSDDSRLRKKISMKMIDESIGLVCICSPDEHCLRFLQIDNGHHATLPVVDSSAESTWTCVTCFNYHDLLLAAGCSDGTVHVWSRFGSLDFNKISQITVKGSIKSISIGKSRQVACTTHNNQLYLIEEHSMMSTFDGNMAAIQTGAKMVKFFWIGTKKCYELNTEIPIRAIMLSPNRSSIAIRLNGSKEIAVYRSNLDPDLIKEKTIPTIDINVEWIIFGDEIFWFIKHHDNGSVSLWRLSIDSNIDEMVTPLDISVFNRISSVQSFHLNGNNNLLIVLTDFEHFFYYLYRIESNEISLKIGPKSFDATSDAKKAMINSDGTVMGFIDGQNICLVNLESGHMIKHSMDSIESDHFIWSTNEGRLFCVQAKGFLTVFISNSEDLSIKMYSQTCMEPRTRVIGFQIPYVYLYQERTEETEERIYHHLLDEFSGLSSDVMRIMIDFLTARNVDLNKVIQSLGNTSNGDGGSESNQKIWLNLARISVKCRDIRTGQYCMSRLKNCRVVADVKARLISDHGDDRHALALLAMNLGLHSEAEEFLRECGNNLALSSYYQSRNEWQKALDCVDKLNYKNVCYKFAKHLEIEENNLREAIKYYELSGTHVFEVPRMLFDTEDTSLLENYCTSDEPMASDDRIKLIRWWGQYCESLGDINQALSAYEKIDDYYNLVRLLCYTGQTEQAKSILSQLNTDQTASSPSSSKDAAMLHLGRHLENSSPQESIIYYLSSGAVTHAIRVCKVNNMVNELAQIIVNYGSKSDAFEFMEKYGNQSGGGGYDDDDFSYRVDDNLLIQLCYKSGLFDQTIQTCIKSNLWSQLREILSKEMQNHEKCSDQERYSVSSETIQMALDMLKSNSEIIEIVIDLILLSHEDKTIVGEIILSNNIEINDKLIEKVGRIIDKSEHRSLLEVLANTALKQGQYFVAAKLFNSIDDRLNSLKSLIRTGDTDKIIQYANIARDKSVFRVAANYLQTINYSDDKLIAKFYQKAGAKDELQRFIAKDPLNLHD